MKKTASVLVFIGCVLFVPNAPLRARESQGSGPHSGAWPTHGWAKAAPASVGLDEKILAGLHADLETGKYPMVDSFAVFRCGNEVFERTYSHDYGTIYAKEAKTRGPLNARLTGPYNYFDPAWHPYYHGTDLHSMQSVSKTVSSIIVGIAVTRGDFKAGLDTPLLKYFDVAKVKNVDERKRRIALRHVLTMSTGLDWNEEVAYDDPRNDADLMEAADDWVQYVIDRPMAHEPGKVFNYSSGVSELLAYIFQKETGQDIEKYGEKYLFTPLGMDHYWKRSPMGVVDTEGGLFLRTTDLAKIGYLYLHDGMWDGQQIVSKDWVKQSLSPFIDAEEGFKYGFKWWLLPRTDRQGYVWMARGFGGQRLMVFPEENLIAVFTGWEILKDPVGDRELVNRILPAVGTQSCRAMPERSGNEGQRTNGLVRGNAQQPLTTQN
jgi:CubicO group peptidase (beta-lactamase class C family)